MVAGHDGSLTGVIHLCRNDSTVANTAPTAPGSPAANLDGDTVRLGWSAASDSQTPAAGLTYNLRLGTAPGAGDVVPPMANSTTGWRRVPELGNAGHGLTALGSDFRGSRVVTPAEGLAAVGAAGTFQPGEGRAAGYAGFPVP